MPTISVLDSTATPVAIEKPNANGQAAMADSRPVVLASDHSDITTVIAGVPEMGFYPGAVPNRTSAGETVGLLADEYGALYTRGGVTTDEASFREDYSGAALTRSIGSCTFVNGGRTVTGTGFTTADPPITYGDYVKLSADADSALAQVIGITDTTLHLRAAYTGSSATGAAVRSATAVVTGTGGSYAVGSSAVTMTCGTTASVTHSLWRHVDYGPLVFQAGFSVSQRIANQDIYLGFGNVYGTDYRVYARFRFNGTTNTTVLCETGWAEVAPASGSDVETTTVTLPQGAISSTTLDYRIEVRGEAVSFYIGDTRVAVHQRITPKPYDILEAGTACVNGVTPGSSTTTTLSYMTCANVDSFRVTTATNSEIVVATRPPQVNVGSYSVAGVIVINTDLLIIDTPQCDALIVQCVAMGTTGVVTPQWSGDGGTTWTGGQLIPIGGGALATTFNAAGMWVLPVVGPRVRLRLTTATTAGTTTLRVWCKMASTPIMPSSLTVTASNLSCNVAQMNGVTTAMNNGTASTGTQRVAIASDNTANSNPWLATAVASAAQGASTTHHAISAASTNATSVKASAGTINTLQVSNANAAIRYLKLYNKASAPTVGTDTPVMTCLLPANSNQCVETGAYGIRFSTGIAYALTTGMAVADTGAVAATEHSVGMFYT